MAAGEVVAVMAFFFNRGECSFGFVILGGVDKGELGDAVAEDLSILAKASAKVVCLRQVLGDLLDSCSDAGDDPFEEHGGEILIDTAGAGEAKVVHLDGGFCYLLHWGIF